MLTKPLTLAVAGDVVPTRPLFPGRRPATRGFAEVVELITRADIAVVNLDIPLTARGHPREKIIAIRAPLATAGDLSATGFDVVSVANNHGMDYGEIGLLDTIEALDAAGTEHVGGGADLASATAPAIVDRSGSSVGVLGWTCLLPTGAAASPERPGQAPLHIHASWEINPYLHMEEPTAPPTVRTRVDAADLERALTAVANLRDRSDFVVALIHWGGGLTDEISEYQRPLGY